jgi:hypothetical protein
MIISDLNHVEVVSEETETRIVGGAPFNFYYNFSSSYAPPAGFPGAYGSTISISTFTMTPPKPGFAGSSSSSSSSTVSFYYW